MVDADNVLRRYLHMRKDCHKCSLCVEVCILLTVQKVGCLGYIQHS